MHCVKHRSLPREVCLGEYSSCRGVRSRAVARYKVLRWLAYGFSLIIMSLKVDFAVTKITLHGIRSLSDRCGGLEKWNKIKVLSGL